MEKITHEPVLRAIEELKALSRNQTETYHALAREKALRDEISFFKQAMREGLEKGEQIGLEKGEQIGLEKGRQEGEQIGMRKASQTLACTLLSMGVLTESQIMAATGLSQAELKALRTVPPAH